MVPTSTVARGDSRVGGALLLVAFAVVVANDVLYAPWPLTGIAGGLDEALYLLGGAQWNAGHVPYRDFWDNKPPSIYLLNAFAWWLSGGMLGIWLLSLACNMAIIVLFRDVCRRLYGAWPALVGTLFFFGAILPYLMTNFVNTFIVFLSLVSLHIFARATASNGRMLSAGFGIGLVWAVSFLFRPNGVLLQSVVVLLLLAHAFLGGGLRRLLATLAMQAAGALVYLIPVAAYFYAAGAVPGMLDCLVRFNAVYVHNGLAAHIKALIWGVANACGDNVFVLAAAGLYVVLYPVRHRLPTLRVLERLMPAVFVAELLLGAASGRLFSHYFAPATLPAGLMVGSMAASLEALPRVGLPRLRWCLYLGLAAPVVLSFLDRHGPALAGLGLKVIHPVAEIGAFVRSHPGNGHIFVWGDQPGAYLLPGVSRDVRYGFGLPFMIPGYVDDALVGRLLGDLDRARPAFIFDLSPGGEFPPLASAPAGQFGDAPAWLPWAVTPPLNALFAYVGRHYRALDPQPDRQFVVYARAD